MRSRPQHLIEAHGSGEPEGEVVDTNDLTYEREDRFGIRREFNPVIQASDLIRLQMTSDHIAKR